MNEGLSVLIALFSRKKLVVFADSAQDERDIYEEFYQFRA